MKRGSSEWTPIYMLLVMVIAAILIATLIKPIMQRAAASATENIETAAGVARTASLLFLMRPRFK